MAERIMKYRVYPFYPVVRAGNEPGYIIFFMKEP